MEAHVLEEKLQEACDTRRVPPVPLEVTNDRTLGDDVDTSLPHASIGKVGGAGIRGTGSVGVGEDGETSLKEGETNEHGTNLR